jgi:hypothetical protein
MAPLILNLGVRWSWMLNITLRPFYPKEGTPLPNWLGSRVCPKADLDRPLPRFKTRTVQQSVYLLRCPGS